METTEQILTRQHATLSFSNGKVEYFSISTQWNTANTVEEAIDKILEADAKYDGKAPLDYAIDKFNNIGCTSFYLTPEELKNVLNVDKTYYSLLGVKYMNEV